MSCFHDDELLSSWLQHFGEDNSEDNCHNLIIIFKICYFHKFLNALLRSTLQPHFVEIDVDEMISSGKYGNNFLLTELFRCARTQGP
jgi:hypothetical protein